MVDVVTERHFREITFLECDENTAQEPAEQDATVALVGRQVVGLALRVIEFLLAGLHVHVGVGQLAEIDFRASYGDALHRALDGHVAENQRWQPFRGESIHGVHGDTVAVGVDELLVDPVAAALGEFVDTQFTGGEHHLTRGTGNVISIDVNVWEIVVGTDFLNLTERVLECMPVPQADVLQRRLIVGGVGRVDGRLRREFALRDAVQSIGLPRQVDVVGNVGPLANQLVRLHDKVADVPGTYLEREITDQDRSEGSHQPSHPGR